MAKHGKVAVPAARAPDLVEDRVADTSAPVHGSNADISEQIASGYGVRDLDEPNQADQAASAQEAKFGIGGGVANTVRNLNMTGSLAALREMTLGGSDQILVHGAELMAGDAGKRAMQQRLSGYQAANPVTNVAGSALGIGLSATLGNEAALGRGGLATKGLGAGGRIMTGAGGLAERALMPQIAEGALARVARGALRTGAENAVLGLGHEISENAVSDKPLMAEKLLAGAGHDFMVGALLGGAGGVAAEGLGRLAPKLEEAAGRFAYRAGGGTKTMAKATERYFPGGVEAAGNMIREEAPALAREVRLGEIEDALKSGSITEQQANAARTNIKTPKFSELTQEDLKAIAERGQKKYGDEIGQHIDRIDEVASKTGQQPKAKDVFESVRRDVLEPLKKDASAAGQERQVEAFLERAERIVGMKDLAGATVKGAEDATLSFRQLKDFSNQAREAWAGNKINPEYGAMKSVRDALERELGNRAEVVAESAGSKFAAPYKAAKTKYQAMKDLAKRVESGIAAGDANQYFGLTDKIIGSATGAVGGAVGGPVGGLLAGGAAGLASKMVRSRFNFWASEAASKAAGIANMARAAGEVDARIGEATAGFFNAKPRGLTKAALGVREMFDGALSSPKRVQETVRALQQAQNDPVRQQQITSKLAAVEAHAPGVAGAAAISLAKAVAFLANKAPKDISGASAHMRPDLVSPKYAPSDVAKFGKYLKAATNPLGVLDSLENGHLGAEEVEAVKELYPGLYKQIQENIHDSLAAMTTQPSYAKRKQLKTLFGVATDPTLEYKFIQETQKTFAPSEPQETGEQSAGPASNAPARPIHVASSFDLTTTRESDGD